MRIRVADLVGSPGPLPAREAATRFVGVVCLIAVGYLHLMDISHKIEEGVWLMALLFACLICSALVLAAALVIADESRVRFVWVAVAGLAAGAMFGYFVSRALPLPGMADHQGDWVNAIGVLAGLAEAGLVLLSGFALRDRVLRRQGELRARRRRARTPAPIMSALTILALNPTVAVAHGGEEMTPEEMQAVEMGHAPGAMDHAASGYDPLLGGTELLLVLLAAIAFAAWAGYALRARIESRPRGRSQEAAY